MGTDWVDGLKVVELKEELKKRGLNSSGVKAVLAARLKEAVEAEENGAESSKEPSPAAEEPAAVEEPAADEPMAADEPAATADESPPREEAATTAAAAAAEEPETAEEPSAAAAEAEEPAADIALDEAAPATPEGDTAAAAEPAEAEMQEDQPEAEPAVQAGMQEDQPEAEQPATTGDEDDKTQPAAALPAPVVEEVAPVSPHAGAQEDVLDFGDQDAVEQEQEPESTPPSSAAAVEDEAPTDAGEPMEADAAADEAGAATTPAVKRTAEEPAGTQLSAADAELEQPQPKRSKRTLIPRPEEALQPRVPADKASPAAAAAATPASAGGPAATPASGGSERKRKHAPIPLPPARGSSKELTKQTSSAAAVAAAAANEPTADKEEAIAKAVAAAGDVPPEATAALRITGLKRPLTAAGLLQKLSETGAVLGMQLTTIRDKAWVIFKEPGHAHATRQALQGKEWPEGNKSRLALQFISVELAQYAIDKAVQREPTAAEVAHLHRQSSGGAAAATAPAAAEREGSAAAAAADGDPAAGAGAGASDAHAANAADSRGGVRGRGMPTAGAVEAAAAAAAAEAAQERQKQQQRQPVQEPLTLDDLFKKTDTKPHLYYLPLTEEQVAAKRQRLSRGDSAAVTGGQAEPVGPAVQEGLRPQHREH